MKKTILKWNSYIFFKIMALTQIFQSTNQNR
jgi:hypothetical protein